MNQTEIIESIRVLLDVIKLHKHDVLKGHTMAVNSTNECKTKIDKLILLL